MNRQIHGIQMIIETVQARLQPAFPVKNVILMIGCMLGKDVMSYLVPCRRPVSFELQFRRPFGKWTMVDGDEFCHCDVTYSQPGETLRESRQSTTIE